MTQVKNNLFKRCSCVVLMLALLLSFLPVTALAATTAGTLTVPSNLADGSYTVSGTVETDDVDSFASYPINVTVTVANGAVSDFTVTGVPSDSTNYSTNAIDGTSSKTGVKAQIVGKSAGTYTIDAVSKATCSSKAVVSAVNAALEKAVKVETPAADPVYALVNIPYDEFYAATGVAVSNYDYDAVSAATNKVGNYGKAGGGYHSGVTASIAEDGTVTAVGGENGASIEGVIWAVKVDSESALASLGGDKITGSSAKTVATLGKGQTSSTNLVSYETLMEAKTYSYYILDTAPDYYMDLTVANGKATITGENGTAKTESAITADVAYGSNWGDVDLTINDADDASDKIFNAVVFTAKDADGKETKVGLVHLYNVWAYNDIAWYADEIPELDGKTITNIRYYCSVKDADLTDGAAPAYTNYVYDYPMNTEVSPVYTSTITAKFTSSEAIAVSGLPSDAVNVKAKVYHTTGGRNAVYTYLTPLVVDPSDDDIDPTTVAVTNGVITITPGSVTNSAGETKTYGEPVEGTEYTVELSCDNYILRKFTVTYGDCPQDSTCPLSSFTDLSATEWYHDGVHYCIEAGLMQGYENGKFGPNDRLSRAQLAQILYNEAGKPAVSKQSTFTDVPATEWYADAIAWAQQNNIVAGIGGGKFAPNEAVTREQLAAMLYRSAGSTAVTGKLDFVDAAGVSDWAEDAMLWATQNKIINGALQSNGTLLLNAQLGATRAEAATMLENYYNK